MNGRRALLYAACFVGLAATTAVVAARIADPDLTLLLLVAVAAGTLAGAPGSSAAAPGRWPCSFCRSAPTCWRGRWSRAAPDGRRRRRTSRSMPESSRPGRSPTPATSSRSTSPERPTFGSCCRWSSTRRSGTAAFLASACAAAAGDRVLLVLAGFGFTADESARDLWPALAFVLLAGGMLAVSRSLKRERLRATDVAGGATATWRRCWPCRSWARPPWRPASR